MAILINDVDPNVQYTAGNGQTIFTVPFEFFDDTDLVVDVDGTLKVLATDYTVTGAGVTGGGNVTFLVAMSGGEIVTIYRDVPVERLTDFQTNGDILAETINTDFDRIVAMIQQLESGLGRTLRISQTDTAPGLILPPVSERVNVLLGFDSDGNIRLYTPNQSGVATVIPQLITVAAGQTVVTVNPYQPNTNTQLYILNGAHLTVIEGAVQETSSTTITLSNPPVTESKLIVLSLIPTQVGVTGAANVSYGSATVNQALNNSRLPSIFSLLQLSPNDGDVARVSAFYADGVNGGGHFIYDSAMSRSLADGGTIINPAATGGFDGTDATIAAYLTAQAAGIGNGCWVRQYDGAINITWYGATQAVASPSLQSALTTARNYGGSIYVPPRKFTLSAKVSETFSTEQTDVAIYGDGSGLSKLLVANSSGGIELIGDNDTHFKISGIGFEPQNANAGTALYVAGGGIGNSRLGVIIDDCRFAAPTTGTSFYFNVGAHVHDLTSFRIQNCSLVGPAGTIQPIEGIKVTGNSSDGRISKCAATNVEYAVHITGAAADSEGLIVEGCAFVNVKYGDVRDCSTTTNASTRTPGHYLVNTHINATRRAIDWNSISQGGVHDCLLYGRSSSTETTFEDGTFTNCTYLDIHNNNSQAGIPAGTNDGYVFNGYNEFIKVKNNAIRERDSSIILNEVGGQGTRTSKFQFNVTDGSGQPFEINGTAHTDNRFTGIDGELTAVGTLSASQNVPNATDTTVEFDTLVIPSTMTGLGITVTGTTGEFAIPPGVSKIRASAKVRIATLTGATLRLWLERDNGGGFAAVSEDSEAGAAFTTCQLITQWINVASGDIIRFRVNQDSGAAKTINNSSVFSRFDIEVQ